MSFTVLKGLMQSRGVSGNEYALKQHYGWSRTCFSLAAILMTLKTRTLYWKKRLHGKSLRLQIQHFTKSL